MIVMRFTLTFVFRYVERDCGVYAFRVYFQILPRSGKSRSGRKPP